jgi:formylglycine-generating enzyme required for sulfatase activity
LVLLPFDLLLLSGRAKRAGKSFLKSWISAAPVCAQGKRAMPEVAGPADRRRVLRGGSFNNDRDNLRCANRNNNPPDNRNDNIGFRVVLVAGGSSPR